MRRDADRNAVPLPVVRRLSATGIVTVIGIWDMIVLFSDVFARRPIAAWTAAGVPLFLSGVLLGALLRKKWYVALLASWGAWILDLPAIAIHPFFTGHFGAGMYDGAPFFGIIAAPVLSLGGAYLGKTWSRIPDQRK